MMLLKAAFYPAPRGDTSKGKSVLLPQQTEDELAISEVHSQLDRALNFLRRDVGYSLLDDIVPESGGGVRLGAGSSRQTGEVAPRPRARSCRLPKEQPQEEEEEEEREPSEGTDVLCCSPEIGKYAHYEDDIVLVWRFASLIQGASAEFPVGGAELEKKNDTLYKKVLQAARLMHLCDYHYADVVLTLAYASVYFRRASVVMGHKMSDYEAAHVCTLLIYLAHAFLLDETCPLRVWQQHIFKKYCNLKTLDAALFRIFQMRGFKLRIAEEEEREALSVLLVRTNGCHVRLSSCMNADSVSDVNGRHTKGGHSRSESSNEVSRPQLSPHRAENAGA
eukprot:TRINITY_DN6496_c0_g2_i1.p1 TRINITY_DN6496_c0_g2~~TRINITY_DN6496_c0_g2_i1.p1  ORF type:complete len:335 (+),score=64.90 TRINITY_DN6496_c0_g2_i1:151-1155(+)